MDALIFQKYAPRYSMIGEAVIITDEEFTPKYINPAAAADPAVPTGPKMLKLSLTPQSMLRVRLTQGDGQPRHFRQKFGRVYPKIYSVEVQKDGELMIFRLVCRQSTISTPRENDPETVINNSLHQLLSAGELMCGGQVSNIRDFGQKCRKATLKAIRAHKHSTFLTREPDCAAVHFPTLLSQILEPAIAHARQQHGADITLSPLTGEATVQCSAVLMRHTLTAMLVAVIKYGGLNVDIRYAEFPGSCMLTLIGRGGGRPIPPTPESAEHTTPTPADIGLGPLAEIIHRQQGVMELKLTEGHLLLCLSLPRAFVEIPMKERLSIMLNEDISTLDIEFSEL